MPQVGKTARVRLQGSTGVNYNAPLEDLSQEVYRVARKYAQIHRFAKHVHSGPYGDVKGVAGPMVMSSLIRQLFPDAPDEALRVTRGLIMQVLRKTDAAVCIAQHHGRDKSKPMTRETMPTWFIADSMPENIVVVALAHAKHSAEDANRLSPTFSEKDFLTKREQRLPDEEVERPAGEVTVTPGTATAQEQALAEQRDRIAGEHQRLLKRVLEELQTSPMPLTARDLADVINPSEGWDYGTYTYRDTAYELVKSGDVVRRKETPDERRVRGRGHLPKGGPMWLFAPAPEPVPIRTTLPDQAHAYRPAAEWAAERTENFDRDAGLILERMFRKGHRGDQAPRTLAAIAGETGLARDRVKEVLDVLERRGQVARRNSGWYPVKEGKNPSEKTTERPSETPVESPLPPPPAVDKVIEVTAAAPAAPVTDNLELVKQMADRLGVKLPSGDAKKIAHLTEENALLLKENTHLRAQVAALQAAVAAFQV